MRKSEKKKRHCKKIQKKKMKIKMTMMLKSGGRK
jgi:hypothetical protein